MNWLMGYFQWLGFSIRGFFDLFLATACFIVFASATIALAGLVLCYLGLLSQ